MALVLSHTVASFGGTGHYVVGAIVIVCPSP